MTKKRTFNFKQLEGSSSVKSGGKDRNNEGPTSVNARLAELRRLEGRDAALKKRELADLVNQRISHVAGRVKPAQIFRFRRLLDPEFKLFDSTVPSLLHLATKAAADQWHLFDETDLPALAELPLRMRLHLLMYLGHYGPPIDIDVFDALTQGTEPVTCLDLAGLIGHGTITLPRLTKLAKAEPPASDLIIGSNDVLESWDQEELSKISLASNLSLGRFGHVTHLSMSHPPTDILWRDLLQFIKNLPNVTHLSLAHWPRPTLTPNLATTTVDGVGREVAAGGSSYYSDLDEDFIEPAALLRQLSNHLLHLQWLDLEGCANWVPALAEDGRDAGHSETIHHADRWSSTSCANSFLLNNWKNLVFINVRQGWKPDFAALGIAFPSHGHHRTQPNQRIEIESDGVGPARPEISRDEYGVLSRQAAIWSSNRKQFERTAARVNRLRHLHGCKFIKFDFE